MVHTLEFSASFQRHKFMTIRNNADYAMVTIIVRANTTRHHLSVIVAQYTNVRSFVQFDECTSHFHKRVTGLAQEEEDKALSGLFSDSREFAKEVDKGLYGARIRH